MGLSAPFPGIRLRGSPSAAPPTSEDFRGGSIWRLPPIARKSLRESFRGAVRSPSAPIPMIHRAVKTEAASFCLLMSTLDCVWEAIRRWTLGLCSVETARHGVMFLSSRVVFFVPHWAVLTGAAFGALVALGLPGLLLRARSLGFDPKSWISEGEGRDGPVAEPFRVNIRSNMLFLGSFVTFCKPFCDFCR